MALTDVGGYGQAVPGRHDREAQKIVHVRHADVVPAQAAPDGREIWSNLPVFPVHHDHADSYRFGDLDGDGRIDAMAATSDIGMVVLEARTGRIRWMRRANHAQQMGVVSRGPARQPGGGERPHLRGPRRRGSGAARARAFLPGGRRRAGVTVALARQEPDRLDLQAGPSMGALVQWPQHPINGNPDFVKGDWRGDGSTSLFPGRRAEAGAA